MWASLFLLVLFTVLYLTLGMQWGLVWKGEFFHQIREGETLTYRGKWAKFKTEVTVSPEGALTFRVDGVEYGPYQVRFDPEAAEIKGDWEGPVDGGVVVSQGERELYRGAYYATGLQIHPVMLCAAGEPGNVSQVAEVGDNYQKVYLSVDNLVYFALGEGLTHRGMWYGYAAGTFFAVMGIVSLLFADRRFRWSLSWYIRDAEKAEPTDYQLTMRSILGGFLFFSALFLYWMGLTLHD